MTAGDDRSAALAATDLALSFGDVRVLDGVSLTVPRGDVVVVVGPNGCGKTTLLEVLAGLRTPDEGSVERAATDGRSVAYLPQRPAFRPGLSVERTLRFYAGLVADETDVAGLLDRVGLLDARDRPVEALSGGMFRLLGIAQALVGDPPAVVLDEPTSGLDPDFADLTFAFAAEMADEGRGVVIASHDLAGVEGVADTVAVLANGEFRVVGTPGEVLAEAEADSLREAFRTLVGRRREGDDEAPGAAVDDRREGRP